MRSAGDGYLRGKWAGWDRWEDKRSGVVVLELAKKERIGLNAATAPLIDGRPVGTADMRNE